MSEVTRTLARYVVESTYADIPEAVRQEAARALLNWAGCAVGSSRHETVECALAAIGEFAGGSQAGILGRRERLDILNAALINGISSHVLDYDDTHARAIHPSAPVLPAILALAEWRQFSGEQLVHAFVLGVEAECRVGLSVFPEHYERGWHITGSAGVFGAAAAAGKLLGLNEQQMTWALGIAATQSSGLRAMFGSMCKSLHPGHAAHNGLTAALLASKNFTSSERAIEAPRGWGNVLSTKFDPAVITAPFGERYELMSNMYKPFACGLVVHATIDACIQLRNEHALQPVAIAKVELTVCPIVMELTAITDPKTGLEGKFSIFHAAAAAIVFGAGGEAEFSNTAVRDPRVVALRKLVTAAPDPELRRIAARVTIRLTDGRVVSKRIDNALGTLARPMSDADLEAKCRALTDGIIDASQTNELIRLCWSVAALPDAGAIVRAAMPTV
ncbi:MAG: 2-methylcitrate dehydratase [Betaproteobacteria bacterium]|nr:2-methylcitrate dehydratase [Betaproteobacteria bacterium]